MFNSLCRVISAVMAVSAFNGLNTHAWTWWVVFAVSLGPVLIWAFLVSHGHFALVTCQLTVLAGHLFSHRARLVLLLLLVCHFTTLVLPLVDILRSGNAYYLFRAAYFWLSIPLVFILALLPRYLARAVKEMYWPNDLDVLRAVRKLQPQRDIVNDPQIGGHWNNLYHLQYQSQHSVSSIPPPQPPITMPGRSQRSLIGSRTDMATGLRSSSRALTGFQHDFEEGGYAMRRMATNLSERRLRQLQTGDDNSASRRFSLRRSIRNKTLGRLQQQQQ